MFSLQMLIKIDQTNILHSITFYSPSLKLFEYIIQLATTVIIFTTKMAPYSNKAEIFTCFIAIYGYSCPSKH